jgi:hypothetical protein
MDKVQIEQYLNTVKETLTNLFSGVNINLGSADLASGLIALGILFLVWSAFKFGIQVGKNSLDYNHRIEILGRVSKVFHEVQDTFDKLLSTTPEDSDEALLKRQADQLRKLSAVLRKDLSMWSMTAPTGYLNYTHKLVQQIEKSADNLEKTKLTSKMTEGKIQNAIKKHHTPVISNYTKMVKAMRKDIRSDGVSKIIKQIIHG